MHCSWNMNSAQRHVNSKKRVNNKFFIIFFLLFSVFSKINGIQINTQSILIPIYKSNKIRTLLRINTATLKVCLGSTFCASKMHVCILAFFFFFELKCLTFFLWTVYSVHCSRIHKFHFLTNFSLKMGLMVLFTHLKIILLQCFLVFSCIQTDPTIT